MLARARRRLPFRRRKEDGIKKLGILAMLLPLAAILVPVGLIAAFAGLHPVDGFKSPAVNGAQPIYVIERNP